MYIILLNHSLRKRNRKLILIANLFRDISAYILVYLFLSKEEYSFLRKKE